MLNIKKYKIKIKPKKINEIIGQDHLFKKNGILNLFIKTKKIYSMIFFGPPGVGKTTTATLISKHIKKKYLFYNPSFETKTKLLKNINNIKKTKKILIIEEIHRLDRPKQDLLLSFIENKKIIIIGTTTINPIFSLNSALRSRILILEFKYLKNIQIIKILKNIIKTTKKNINNKIIKKIAINSYGDARRAINTFKILIKKKNINKITELYNIGINKENKENIYNLLSALQKSIRGDDVNASLYYLAKLINFEDLNIIHRRLIVIAYEDIGLANPPLCSRVINICKASEKIGLPESRILLSNIVIECALSQKSKSAIKAIDKAIRISKKYDFEMPKYLFLNPKKIDNLYDYNNKKNWNKIQYLPNEIKKKKFYYPENYESFEKIYIKKNIFFSKKKRKLLKKKNYFI